MAVRPVKIGDAPAAKSEFAAREQLLIAVGQLMTENASTDVSLSEIAQRSGLNSALVKYYFGNKSGLLMELLRKALGPSMEQLQHLKSLNISPHAKLRTHISGMVNSYFKFPFVNHLMHQMMAEEPLLYGPMIAEEFGKPVAEAQKAILEAGLADGSFRAVDPMLFYFQVVGACDQLFFARYQLQHIFGIDGVDENLKRQYVDHIYGIAMSGIAVASNP